MAPQKISFGHPSEIFQDLFYILGYERNHDSHIRRGILKRVSRVLEQNVSADD